MSMNYKKNQSGFTLIDTIIGIVIISFIFTGILFVLVDLNYKSLRNETLSKGIVYGNSVMNYIRVHRFDENYDKPWTYPLGQEGGDFDDIDDFTGADWSIIPGYVEEGYQATSEVFYINHLVSLMISYGATTDYKRIIVTVSHDNLVNPIVFSSIKAPYAKL